MNAQEIRDCLAQGQGIFQLIPTWVPRSFNQPGHRLRLHPDDYFAFGMDRGGVTERWLGSVTRASNGPKTGPTEGMSFVLAPTGERFLLADAVKLLKEELIGKGLQEKHGNWPAYAKLYDYENPLFHHLHLKEADARRIGCHGKPEAYYFPIQYNAYLGKFPLTYFGFDPSTTKEEVKRCIRDYGLRDTRITELSRAYRVQLGTGWYTPGGVVHAPASVVTYEPQWNSDVNTILENVTMGEVNPHHLLTDCQPPHEQGDVEALFAQIDWEESTRRDYRETYFRAPKRREQTPQPGLTERWIVYANEWMSAKELTVAPGAEVSVFDGACYGALVVQGHGRFGAFSCEAPGLLRIDDLSDDEFFVSEQAAVGGVKIRNNSVREPLVILQNFADNHPEAPQSV